MNDLVLISVDDHMVATSTGWIARWWPNAPRNTELVDTQPYRFHKGIGTTLF